MINITIQRIQSMKNDVKGESVTSDLLSQGFV
jgi:hypothetical protein